MEETNNSPSMEMPYEDNNNLHKSEPETDLHSQVHHHDIFSPTNILLIILPIVIIILLISILIITLILRRIKSSRDDTTKGDSTTNSVNNGDCMFLSHSIVNINASPDVKGRCIYGANSVRNPTVKVRGVQVFTFKELEVATDRFSDGNVIGNGGFGVVYKGALKDGTIAAIKRLHREGKQGERAFRIEVDLLSRLNCTYLVQLHGYCADQHHRLLIFEFMPNGSLYGHLHSSISQYRSSLNWGIRLRIALDCARALEYLHEHTVPSVIHRDFKSSNILLNQHFRAKVSDFGLAKTGSDKINGLVSTRVLGTTGYLAPEYASTGKLTTKSDVYSYGVVLLELITGRVPVDTNRPPGEHVLVSWALPRLTNRERVMEMVDPSLQGQYSRKDLIQVAAIAAMCVQGEADYRPLMTDVVQSLIPLAKNHSTSCSSNSGRFSQNASPQC